MQGILNNVDFDEAKQSQLTAVEMLIKMGYTYISRDEVFSQRGEDESRFLLQKIASHKLMEINSYEVDGSTYKFSEKDIQDVLNELETIPYEGLIDTSQKIFNMVMPTSGGKTIKVSQGGKFVSKNFRFIDFEHPENNDFHVSVEYIASGKQAIRVDVICFVNGIPFAIIENKKSSVEVEKAIDQLNKYQGPEFCPKLFTYTQLLAASNGKKLRYGTTGTLKKFYSTWKEKGMTEEEDKVIEEKQKMKAIDTMQKEIPNDIYELLLADLNGQTYGHEQKRDRIPTEQDISLVSLFEPSRLLDLTKNHILFDAGIKKISRYQQYFAIRKMLERIHQEREMSIGTSREGGLVWHTQGSGKSLTMVTFVKALIEDPHIENPRVIIVTDRKDLDRQIKGTFKNCNLKKNVIQATSGKHLVSLIREKNLAVITTLVHKFESARNSNPDFIDNDKNIFVLIDEAHRTQNGIANFEMNQIIPNACYIGFTGTPLMKSEKASWKKFGGYIDRYTIDDALGDKVVLPLIYEGRYVPLEQNATQIDKHTERLMAGMNQLQRKKIQAYIDTKIIKNNPKRIAEIALDIENHYVKNFQGTGLKAQIVAPSKFSAILFQKFFVNSGKISTGVIISNEADEGNEEDVHKTHVVQYLKGIKERHITVEKYEKDVIDSFKYNEDGIEIIIVVDKLLTGFDAPRNTVLYLAKDLHDHGLLQAIARVNRLFDNKKLPKTAGFIIDYSENAKNIKTAMKLFGNYDEDELQGTLIDVQEKIHTLEQSFGELQDIFKEISTSTDDQVYLEFLSNDEKRKEFNEKLNTFIRIFSECMVLQDFVHEFDHMQIYQKELKKLLELKKTASLKYAETVDINQYKLALTNILDQYVDAQEVELLTKQVSITDTEAFNQAVDGLGSDRSKAEAIAAQLQRTIREDLDRDPVFYTKFSEKISEILEQLKARKMADIEALNQMKLFKEEVLHKNDDDLPQALKGNSTEAIFYRNLKDDFNGTGISEAEYITIISEMVARIGELTIVDWYKNPDVKRRIMNDLDDYLYDEVVTKRSNELSFEQMQRIIRTSLHLAEHNFELFTHGDGN